MKKRIITLMLVFAMLFTMLPMPAQAAEREFIANIVQQEEVPEGYTGIYNEAQLRAVENDVYGKYILMDDIEVTNQSALCINTPFRGILNGNGYTVSGIRQSAVVERGDDIYLGLFGKVDGAMISNLKVSGSISLEFISSGGYLRGNLFVGGIAAYGEGDLVITNCVNEVSITYGDTATIMQKNHSAGGILGSYSSYDGDAEKVQISFCKNTADLFAKIETMGGIVGLWEADLCDGFIYACLNTGNINSMLASSGILAEVDQNDDCILTVDSCANEGEIHAEVAGGILANGFTDGTVTIKNCLNTGYLWSRNAPADVGGIVGAFYGTASQCVNVGRINGAPTGSGIAGKIKYADALTNCYWLDTGRSQYGLLSGDGTMLTILTDRLSAEQMKKQESFKNFDFPNTWTLEEGMDYPYPTALYGVVMDNTYKIEYIAQTSDKINYDDYRFTAIMGGSGAGGFAGALKTNYEDAKLHWVNGTWNFIELVNGVLSANVEIENTYDVLLTDLITGTMGQENYAIYISDAFKAKLSDLVTDFGALMNAGDVIAIEKQLEELAKYPTIYGDEAKGIVAEIRKNALKETNWAKASEILTVFGGFVSINDAVNAGCDSVEELFDFYLLCNTYVEATLAYADLLRDTANACAAIDPLEGALAKKSINDFANKISSMAKEDPTVLYFNCMGNIEEVLTTTMGAVFDICVTFAQEFPLFMAIKSGVNLGVPTANNLTSMDAIAYNGSMLCMAGFLAKGMHRVVMNRQAAFEANDSYENSEALNTAINLYLHLQILACDYAIGYSTAISSANISSWNAYANKDKVAESVQVLSLKAELMQLVKTGKEIYISDDGEISGFIAKCPVTVIVTEKATGREIAWLETGEMTVASDAYGAQMILGENGEEKAGFYDPDLHEVTILGEGDGSMDLFTFNSRNGHITEKRLYQDLPVEDSILYSLADDHVERDDGTVITAPEDMTYRNPFEDVAPGMYYHDAVLWASREGVTTGTDASHFSPDRPCTRSQVVTFLWRAMGSPKPQSTVNPFVDVPKNSATSWYYDAVLWAVEAGITTGVDATHFAPDKQCSRAEVAMFLWRVLEKPSVDTANNPFPDVNSGDWFYEPVLWAVEAGVTNGTGNGTFAPAMVCSRGQIVTFLYRALAE